MIDPKDLDNDLDTVEDPLVLFRLASTAINRHQEAIDHLADVRSRAMAALHARGYSYKELADTLGLSAPRVGQLVSGNDASAIGIIKAWAAIEQTVTEILGDEAAYGRGFRDTLNILRKTDRFGDDAVRDLEHLRQLRNAVVHGRQDLSPEEAGVMADKAIYLNALIRVILSDSPSPDGLSTWSDESLRRLETLATASNYKHYETGWWSCSYILGPAEDRISLPALRRVLRDIRGKETGWPAWITLDGIGSTKETVVGDSIECWLPDTESSDFWRANPRGRMFLLRRLQEDYDFPGIRSGTFLDLVLPIWGTGECLLHAGRLAERLKANTVEIEMSWHGLAGRQLEAKAGPTARSLMPGKVCNDGEVKQRIKTPTASIPESLPRLVKELTSPLYARFDFFEPRDDLYVSELDRMRMGLRG
jgi:transcriptional regulator with XRE-family HTH domain